MLEGRIKLLGEDHGEGGVDALSHLDLRDCEGDFAVRIDAHESIRREIRGRLRSKRSAEPGNGDAEDPPPPAVAVAFSIVRRVSFGAEEI
jgi:hypothetical protein